MPQAGAEGSGRPEPRWRPVLDGALASRARECAVEIGERLRNPEQLPSTPFHLADGDAGLALLHAFLAPCFPGRGFEQAAGSFWERAVDALASAPATPFLFGGFAGVAWATELLRDRLLDADGEDPNEAIDAALAEVLELRPWPHDVDLVGGLAGLGVYARARLPRPSGVALAERTIDLLAELAVPRSNGLSWRTPPALVAPERRERYPEGLEGLGLAHGVPGVIGLLAEIHAAGVRRAEIERLLEPAVAWLLAQEGAGEHGSRFGYWVGERGPRGGARLAWCYGDLGVAAALLRAGQALERERWLAEGLRLARRAAALPVEETGVVDACLCHGAAGLAHAFNRFAQATGDASLREAARAWFERTLGFRKPGQGIGGFQVWAGADDWAPGQPAGGSAYADDPGLIFGAAGIALALLAATSEVEPAWDGCFLLALPPSAATAG